MWEMVFYLHVENTCNNDKRGRVAHKTNLNSPLFIEVPVPSQQSQYVCISMCVLGVSILPLFLWCFSSIIFCCCYVILVFLVFQFIGLPIFWLWAYRMKINHKQIVRTKSDIYVFINEPEFSVRTLQVGVQWCSNCKFLEVFYL